MKNFFNFFDKIFILHIESSIDRKENVKTLIKALGTKNIEILAAVTPDDPRFLKEILEIPIKSFPNCFRCEKLQCGDAECNNILNAPQIACFQTHLNVMKTIIDHGYTNVLVLEDDVYLHEYCNGLLQQSQSIQQLIVALDNHFAALIKLGWAMNLQHKNRQKVSVVAPDLNTMSNPAYALNNKAASLIHDSLKKGLNHTADVIIHHFDIKGLKRSRIDPPLFSEESLSSGKIESFIHPKEKYLHNLQVQLKTCSQSEVDEIQNKIIAYHQKVKKHIKHCTVINFAELNASDWMVTWDAEKVIVEDCELGIHNLLDPLIQSLCFNIQPVFILSAKVIIPSVTSEQKLVMKKVTELILATNEFLSKTGVNTLISIQNSETSLGALQRISKTKVIIESERDKKKLESWRAFLKRWFYPVRNISFSKREPPK